MSKSTKSLRSLVPDNVTAIEEAEEKVYKEAELRIRGSE